MGCITSKQTVSVTPSFDNPVAVRDNVSGLLGPSFQKRENGLGKSERKKKERDECDYSDKLGESLRRSYNGRDSFSLRLGSSRRFVEAEQVAAGWPAWLSAVAGEAIHGWIPLRADSFEKLEKIGQGTYSNVFQARHVENGRLVALKKVRFDNFQPESVSFMAREIMILRRLDHPNVMKLEGLITSRLSNSIYLVFEYMEHDLSGLLSCPDIKFNDSQVKCYMRQLLSGIEHCHSRGVMHRDIKASNILINNEGILKLGDFGLANYVRSRNRKPLTSRVVTLWYRPPELLLGSTNYGASVDLWSVGCVFAEILIGRPILKGRTEVEQLHKIFRLCGSPPEEYWKKSKLPHATIYKPHHAYESSLREKCKGFSTTALNLLETFLSLEPHKRGTASSALSSEYFKTKPYPCDPSSLPKYPPNKEIDAKSREEVQSFSKRAGARVRASGASRKPRRVRRALQEEPNSVNKLMQEIPFKSRFAFRNNESNTRNTKGKGGDACTDILGPSFDTVSEASHIAHPSSPVQVSSSSSFAWAKKRQREDAMTTRSYSRSSSNSQFCFTLNPSSILNAKNEDITSEIPIDLRGNDSPQRKWRQKTRFDHLASFDVSDVYRSQELLAAVSQRDGRAAFGDTMGFKGQEQRVEFSGPLLPQSNKIDEFLQKHESNIRQAVRKNQRGGRE